MAFKQKQWAVEKRIELRDTLGNHCAHCRTKKKLEFDCIIPKGDEHHRMDTSARMSFYRKQHKENNLQLLCGKCNQMKALKDRELYPF